MKIQILGSGAWGGIPAPFCSCRVCSTATEDHLSKNARTRPQLLFTSADSSFLLEVSPDIRLQSTRWRLPPIRNFVISHYHFDHMRGLYELHAYMKQMSPGAVVHCSSRTSAVIRQELGYLPLEINTVRPFEPFRIFDFTITPLPVYHEYAQDDALPVESLENTFGYLVECNGKRAAYLADYYRIPERVVEMVRGIPIIIADGTYLLTDGFRDMKRNHVHGGDITSLMQEFGAATTYYHSISHLTHKTHDEIQSLLPPTHIATYDGMWLLE